MNVQTTLGALAVCAESADAYRVAHVRRDKAIVAAIAAGATCAEVADLVGLTRARVWQIAQSRK